MNKLLYMIVALHSRVLDVKDRERGATATEYALLVALIAVAIAITVGFFGTELEAFFNAIGNKVKGWVTAAG
jgi:pilus assembly protein Flp/PilA